MNAHISPDLKARCKNQRLLPFSPESYKGVWRTSCNRFILFNLSLILNGQLVSDKTGWTLRPNWPGFMNQYAPLIRRDDTQLIFLQEEIHRALKNYQLMGEHDNVLWQADQGFRTIEDILERLCTMLERETFSQISTS